MLNGFCHIPNELGDIARLTNGAIDGNFKVCMVDIASLRLQGNGANGRRFVKGFADAPWTPLLFHFVLQIAARHVQTNGVTINVFFCIGGFDVSAAGSNGHHQFNFMVQVLSQAGVGHLTRLAFIDHHQRICWFQKEKRWFTARKSHFFGVLFVVAADAINTSDWKSLSLT